MRNVSIMKNNGRYKHTLISSIVNTDDICELLFDKQPYTEKDVENLLYTQIFPFLYTEDTQTETKSYICIEVVPKKGSPTIKGMNIIIWVYAHKDIMTYEKVDYEGCSRVDVLADMVMGLVQDSHKYGIGKPEFVDMHYFYPNDKFYGWQIVFNSPDFKFTGDVK